MDLADIILLSLALGVDCFIVSFSQGLIFKANRRLNSFKLACSMGLFQGLMPVIGYIAAVKVYDTILPYSRWIVFGIFFVLGLHFILESFNNSEQEQIQCIGLKCLLSLSVATSIDALISGVSIRLTDTDLVLSCLIIGVGSFLMSVAGFWIGNFIKQLPQKYLQTVGGLILVLLAIKNIVLG